MILEIEKALNCLNKGGILIYPSDTIWAIGCDATNLKAINKIYKIKKRNRSKPFICLMNDLKMSDKYVKNTNEIKNYLKNKTTPTTVIYDQVKKYEEMHEANESTYWLVFELLWRDFFRFMFKKYQTKFFLYAGIKSDKPNSKSLNDWSRTDCTVTASLSARLKVGITTEK